MSLRFSILLLTLFGACTLCSADATDVSRTFVFRFDDFPGTHLNVQKAVINLFRDNGIPLTVAAIPDDLTGYPEAIDFLAKSAGLECEVALHGWDHSERLHGTVASEMSEFVGLSADEQYARLMRGVEVFKQILGVAPVTFVPPFNTYDTNTVLALRKAGFRYLSADIGRRDVDHGDLACIPQTCLLQDLASSESLGAGLYVVMFHGYDFFESGSHLASLSLEDLERVLTRLAAEPRTAFFNVGSIAETGKYDFSEERLEAAQALISYPGTRFFRFPARWMRCMPAKYETTEVYEQLLLKARRKGLCSDLVAGLGVTVMFAACYMVFASLQRKAPRLTRALWSLAAVGLAALALENIYGVLYGSPGFGYKDRAIALLLAAFLLAWFLRLKQARRQHGET